MTLIDDVVWIEMLLDKDTVEAMETGKVNWYQGRDREDYRCEGLDPKTFPKKEVPMKYWSSDHRIAWEWYFRAGRTGNTEGLPTKLVVAKMPAVRFLAHCLEGDIVIYSDRKTCALKKAVNAENYPDLEFDVKLVENAPGNETQGIVENGPGHLSS